MCRWTSTSQMKKRIWAWWVQTREAPSNVQVFSSRGTRFRRSTEFLRFWRVSRKVRTCRKLTRMWWKHPQFVKWIPLPITLGNSFHQWSSWLLLWLKMTWRSLRGFRRIWVLSKLETCDLSMEWTFWIWRSTRSQLKSSSSFRKLSPTNPRLYRN